MAGGTWVTQNKVRPGVYVNFRGEPDRNFTVGDRGTLAVVTSGGWGPFGEVREITSENWLRDAPLFIGRFPVDDEPYTMAMRKASKMYFVRVGGSGSVKATVTLGGVKVDALYGGTMGNTFSVEIVPSLQVQGSFNVNTYLGDSIVDSQLVSLINQLRPNGYVTFTSAGSLSAASKVSLAGGTSVTPTTTDFGDALQKLESYKFDILVAPISENAQKGVVVAYTLRSFNESGKFFQTVLADYPQADNRHIISVKNGFYVGSTAISKENATIVYAGYRVGSRINESLTYAAIEGATDANPRLSNSETENSITNGEIVFTFDVDRVVVETDINTLKTLGQSQNSSFKKNRVIAVLQSIANDLPAQFRRQFIGKVDANRNGLDLVKAATVSYMNNLENINAIQNFDPATDVTVVYGLQSDSILITIYIQPVDSIEKIYMSVEVK